MNVFDLNCDLTLFDSPLTDPFESCHLRTNLKDGTINDPLESLFSSLPTTYYISSPITPSSNNDTTQDINYLT